MNEQIANKLMQYMSSTEAFITTQVPDFAQQYLQWYLYHEILQMAFFVMFATLGWVFIIKFLPRILKKCEDSDLFDSMDVCGLVRGVSYILCLILTLLTLICIPINTMNIVEIKMAPKVFLVETLAKHLK